jgi:ATP-dependent RNA helicase RhlE
MFDMGFLPIICKILADLPSYRQTPLFSVTMPAEIRTLATDLLRRPVTVKIGARKPVETVRQAICPIEREDKFDMLLELLSQANYSQGLVFTRTKHPKK